MGGSRSLLGMGGSSRSTGPNQGLGAGPGKQGTPENTQFQKDALHPKELNAGDIAGTLPAEEEAPKGDATVPVRAGSEAALQRMAEKVETDLLPAEYRERVIQYMESLRRPAGAGQESEGTGAEKGGQTEGR